MFEDPRYRFQGPLNAAVEMVDRHVAQGRGEHPCLIDAASGECTTYRQLFERVNGIARVLTEDIGFRTGNRVLLRAPNTPMLVACWLAVVKAGGIVVPPLTLPRARGLWGLCAWLVSGVA